MLQYRRFRFFWSIFSVALRLASRRMCCKSAIQINLPFMGHTLVTRSNCDRKRVHLTVSKLDTSSLVPFKGWQGSNWLIDVRPGHFQLSTLCPPVTVSINTFQRIPFGEYLSMNTFHPKRIPAFRVSFRYRKSVYKRKKGARKFRITIRMVVEIYPNFQLFDKQSVAN